MIITLTSSSPLFSFGESVKEKEEWRAGTHLAKALPNFQICRGQKVAHQTTSVLHSKLLVYSIYPQ
jgi:hypothetical protein